MPPIAKEKISIVGTFQRVTWRTDKEDDDFAFACLEDGTSICGQLPEGGLVPGVPYEFHGHWNDHPNGRRFEVDVFIAKEPHSRLGVITYLEKYAPGIGPVKAGKLFDAFGGDAVKTLRVTPELVYQKIDISLEQAKAASEALQRIAKWEDTKIALTTLFKGRGFPGKCIEQAIEKWGILAPARIQRDPFCLLVEGMQGAGFDRCFRLYRDLGLRQDRLKVLLICVWHALRSDSSGNTWLPYEIAGMKLKKHLSGLPPQDYKRSSRLKKKKPNDINKVTRYGRRSKWLATKNDENGRTWIAEFQKAMDEKYLAEKLAVLLAWEPPLNTPTSDVDYPKSESTNPLDPLDDI